ncbi:MAG: carbohydrate ABC transporter permease, partial [Albidovulum sp.]
MIKNRSSLIFAWALLAPAIIYVTIIVAWPLVETFRLSFTDASLKKVTNYVGWRNYTKIFNDTFLTVILRTFTWTFFSVLLKMVIGTCGAVLLNAAVPGRHLFRILTMPPWIVPMAIGIFMWGWMYNGQFGMISGLLQRFGLTDGPVAFLAYGTSAFWATIVTDVWIGVPMVTIYFLAAIQSIPKDLYEAAWTDGASRWMRF